MAGCLSLRISSAVGVLFLIELLPLGARQEAAVGLHVAAFLLVDRAIIAQQLFGLGRAQLAAAQSLGDAGPLVGQPVVDLGTARMIFGELFFLARRWRSLASLAAFSAA